MFGSKKIRELQECIEQLERRNTALCAAAIEVNSRNIELCDALKRERLEHDEECERCVLDVYAFCPHCGRELQ